MLISILQNYFKALNKIFKVVLQRSNLKYFLKENQRFVDTRPAKQTHVMAETKYYKSRWSIGDFYVESRVSPSRLKICSIHDILSMKSKFFQK